MTHWTEKPAIRRALDTLRGELGKELLESEGDGFTIYGLPMHSVKNIVGWVKAKANHVLPQEGDELEKAVKAILAPGLNWKLCKAQEKPRPHAEVLLHTPQYADTMGAICVGAWSGSGWEATDDRDLSQFPPVHYAYVETPEYAGDDEDWKNMGLIDGDYDQEEGSEEG